MRFLFDHLLFNKESEFVPIEIFHYFQFWIHLEFMKQVNLHSVEFRTLF